MNNEDVSNFLDYAQNIDRKLSGINESLASIAESLHTLAVITAHEYCKRVGKPMNVIKQEVPSK